MTNSIYKINNYTVVLSFLLILFCTDRLQSQTITMYLKRHYKIPVTFGIVSSQSRWKIVPLAGIVSMLVSPKEVFFHLFSLWSSLISSPWDFSVQYHLFTDDLQLYYLTELFRCVVRGLDRKSLYTIATADDTSRGLGH